MSQERIYFPGLNGIRFLAAFAVILFHLEQHKAEIDLPSLAHIHLLGNMGRKGVSLFFVLSGFLITYLLLSEIKKIHTVNVKKFYVRRILRIWPLYYLIVVWAFFLFPNLFDITFFNRLNPSNFFQQLILFALLLPNLAKVYLPMVAGAGQSWSVGSEEQFYLIWPVILKRFKNNVLLPLLVIIAVKPLIEVVLLYVPRFFADHLTTLAMLNGTYVFLKTLRIEQMAIGGLCAWLLSNQKERILHLLYHPITQTFNFVLIACILIPKSLVPYFQDIVDAVVFAILVLNVSSNPKSFVKLENWLCNFMGNISYGLYMYHTTMLVLGLKFFRHLQATNPVGFNLLYYSFVIMGTVAISYVSYAYFEKPFLKLKDRFSIVHSTTNANEIKADDPKAIPQVMKV